MIKFFKSNTPGLVVLLALLFVGVRLYFKVDEKFLLTPDINSMVVGKMIGQGRLLYCDIYEIIPFFSAYFFAFLALFAEFPTLITVYSITAILFSFFHIVYFGVLLNNRDILPYRNWFVGLLLVLLFHISYDMLIISPVVLGATFLLLAFSTLLKQMSKKEITNDCILIGVYIGIATCFAGHFWLMLFWVFFVLSMYTNANSRHYSLLILGFLIPFIVVAAFYFIKGELNQYLKLGFWTNFDFTIHTVEQWKDVGIVYLPWILLGIRGYLSSELNSFYTVLQIRYIQVMFLWFFFGILSVFFSPTLLPRDLYFIIFPMAYFIGRFLMFPAKIWRKEILFLGSILYGGWFLYGQQANHFFVDKKTIIKEYNIKNKKIVVLGDEPYQYLINTPTTPYLNWELSKKEFTNFDKYQTLVSIGNNFEENYPEYIIDKQNIMPKILYFVPTVGEKYELKDSKSGIYKFK